MQTYLVGCSVVTGLVAGLYTYNEQRDLAPAVAVGMTAAAVVVGAGRCWLKWH